uniref:HMG box domain-containing protein n=1 Tax=Alexandrium monilatum TaxID=311494 RepID=A0A6T1D9T6_9DINO|mmetsp:Transcript_43644/g.130383  ORF Transcript_43644/g.130383 Transcript_43644/m.130383 type:complete len:211 (+) Transcript_43644:75-707(+)
MAPPQHRGASSTRAVALSLLAVGVLNGLRGLFGLTAVRESADLDRAFAVHAVRPLNSYMLFVKDNRANYAHLSVPEAGKALGEAYRKLEAKDRKKYEQLAKKELKRYEAELKKGLQPKPSKLRTGSKDGDQLLKRPMTAYLFFCQEMRPKVAKDDLSPAEVLRALGAQWQGLTKAKKRKFETKAAKDRARYLKKKEEKEKEKEKVAAEAA